MGIQCHVASCALKVGTFSWNLISLDLIGLASDVKVLDVLNDMRTLFNTFCTVQTKAVNGGFLLAPKIFQYNLRKAQSESKQLFILGITFLGSDTNPRIRYSRFLNNDLHLVTKISYLSVWIYLLGK